MKPISAKIGQMKLNMLATLRSTMEDGNDWLCNCATEISACSKTIPHHVSVVKRTANLDAVQKDSPTSQSGIVL
jgi:hypothetical protein